MRVTFRGWNYNILILKRMSYLVIDELPSSLGTTDMAPVFVGYDEVDLRKSLEMVVQVGSAGQSVDGTFL